MLDLKFIREIRIVRQAIANRHDTAPLDEILQLDGERRQQNDRTGGTEAQS